MTGYSFADTSLLKTNAAITMACPPGFNTNTLDLPGTLQNVILKYGRSHGAKQIQEQQLQLNMFWNPPGHQKQQRKHLPRKITTEGIHFPLGVGRWVPWRPSKWH